MCIVINIMYLAVVLEQCCVDYDRVNTYFVKDEGVGGRMLREE